MQDIHEIEGHLFKFKTDLANLAHLLKDAEQNISKEGYIPGRALIEQIEKFLTQFQVLRAELRSEAIDLGVVLPPTLANPIKVGDLDQTLRLCLNQLAAADAIVVEGRSTLDKALSITHTDDLAFVPLQEGKQKAKALQDKLASLSPATPPAERQKLLDEIKFFEQLLELVASWKTVDDHRCDELREGIAANFSNALAMAASRGKLKLPTTASEPAPAVPAPMPSPAKVPEPKILSPEPPPEEPSSGTPFPWMN